MDRDRRQLVAAAGAAVAAVTVGGGAALLRWLRPDSSSSVDARGTTTTAGAPRTTTSAPASPTSVPTTASPSTTDAPSGPSTTERPSPSPTDTHAVPAGPATSVEVLCRDAWRAAPPTGTLPRHTIGELTVHHTAAVLGDNRKAPARIRNFQKGHQDNGFVDLAYHYVIDAKGNIYAARSTDIPGETYTDYDPTGHFLAVCDGNFEEQDIPPAQLDALARLLAWASAHFGVPTSRLGGHRDEAATACPGERLYAHLRDGSLKAAVDRHLAAGPPQLVVLCGSAGAARVAAIENGSA